MMATVTVNNVSELMAALGKATGDTTIKMAPGDYDNLYISGNKIPTLSNNADVTLTSLDPNNPAAITNMILIGAKNVTFDGLDFDYTAQNGASVSTRPFMLLDSDNITIKNSNFDGDLAKGVNATSDGYGTGIAIGVKSNNNLTIENNTFTDFHKAFVINKGTNIAVTNNDISKMASDGLGFSGVNKVLIEGNYIHDFEAHPNTAAHKDMIQFWARGSDLGSSNVVVRDNILHSGTGTFSHTFLMTTENNTLFKNFTIEDNLIYNAFTHGISFNDFDGIKILSNTILHNPDSGVDMTGLYVPKINVAGNVKNVVINDNITHGITGSKYTGSGNLIVQNTSPNLPNYYGDLFVNALVGGTATVKDLSALPGSIIDVTNVGASITQFGSTTTATSGPDALLLTQAGSELSKAAIAFDISNISDAGGAVDTSGATVVWDFGDGSTGTGLTANHNYAKAGTYLVTGTVTLKDGTKVTSTKQIEVDTPIALSVDFQSGPDDQSDITNAAIANGYVQFVQDQGSKVVKLNDNSYVTYRATSDFFDNTAYTVLADFRKDHLSDNGKIITFSGSFTIHVQKGNLIVSMSTEKGTKWINTKAPVDDQNWHQVGLTFSNKTGTADLYLDGAKISSITGLKGATQVGNKTHDLHVGSQTGNSFDGLIDNVAFLTGALSASEMSTLHNGSKSLDALASSYTNVITAPVVDATPVVLVNTDTASLKSGDDTDTDNGAKTPSTPTKVDTPAVNDDIVVAEAPVETDKVVAKAPVDDDEDDKVVAKAPVDDDEDDKVVAKAPVDDDEDDDYEPDAAFSQTIFPTDTNVAFSGFVGAKTVTHFGKFENDIIDQDYLSGEFADHFMVDVMEKESGSGFENSLGIYQFDHLGNISDVRVIDHNAQTSEGSIRVDNVDFHKAIGFFIIQDGYNRLDQSILNSETLSLAVENGNVILKNGETTATKDIFISHHAGFNADGASHVLSGANPDDTGSALVGFEDQTDEGDVADFQDVVFAVTAVGSDEMSFG